MRKLYYLLPLLFLILSCDNFRPVEDENSFKVIIDFYYIGEVSPQVRIQPYGYNDNNEMIYEHFGIRSEAHTDYSIWVPKEATKVKIHCNIEHKVKAGSKFYSWEEKFWIGNVFEYVPGGDNIILLNENTAKSETEPE